MCRSGISADGGGGWGECSCACVRDRLCWVGDGNDDEREGN